MAVAVRREPDRLKLADRAAVPVNEAECSDDGDRVEVVAFSSKYGWWHVLPYDCRFVQMCAKVRDLFMLRSHAAQLPATLWYRMFHVHGVGVHVASQTSQSIDGLAGQLNPVGRRQ